MEKSIISQQADRQCHCEEVKRPKQSLKALKIKGLPRTLWVLAMTEYNSRSPCQQKNMLSNFLRGYEKVNKLGLKEKKNYLSKMTPEEGFKIYDGFCNMWEKLDNKEGLENLKNRKIKFLIKRRKLFDKIGKL